MISTLQVLFIYREEVNSSRRIGHHSEMTGFAVIIDCIWTGIKFCVFSVPIRCMHKIQCIPD